MPEHKLNIIKDEKAEERNQFFSSRNTRKNEMRAKFERLWLQNPEQFDPNRNFMHQERLSRTWNLLHRFIQPKNQSIVDIGCAAGVFSRQLRDAGARVVALDIAENALKKLRQYDCTHIEPKQDAMPYTSLPDNFFDVVVCMDLIAEMPEEDYRIFFSELARVVKLKGYIICSTPIDIYTEDGVHRFLDLASTEFDILGTVPSYHALYIRLRKLFRWCSFLNNSRGFLLYMEKICRFFWSESGISHIIFIGQRRPLKVEEPEELPLERPKKKQVWE